MLYTVYTGNMACNAIQYTNNCHCTCKLYSYHPFGANDALWSVLSGPCKTQAFTRLIERGVASELKPCYLTCLTHKELVSITSSCM